MGASKNRRELFFSAHPFCAFCGGAKPATTVEHCPPRAMFQNRQWPEGFEFPACSKCNHGTSDEDVLIAMLARTNPFEDKDKTDGSLTGLMFNVNRQYPGLLQKMMPSATEARRQNRALNIKPAPGDTHQEAGPLKVPREMHDAVCVFARKLGKAIYYLETGRAYPPEGSLLMHWFTNAELFREGTYPVFDFLKELQGKAPPLQRGKVFLNNQFEYKMSLSSEHDAFILQARFGAAFGLVIFASTTAGRLEDAIDTLREQTGRESPFAVLQSSR